MSPVQSSNSHIHDRGLARDDYVMLSGGTTQRADRSTMPGDTIVVSMDVERMRPIPLWTGVTQILFNLAVAVAAVSSS